MEWSTAAQDLLLPFPLRIAVGQNIDVCLVSASTQVWQAKSKPLVARGFAMHKKIPPPYLEIPIRPRGAVCRVFAFRQVYIGVDILIFQLIGFIVLLLSSFLALFAPAAAAAVDEDAAADDADAVAMHVAAVVDGLLLLLLLLLPPPFVSWLVFICLRCCYWHRSRSSCCNAFWLLSGCCFRCCC